MLVVKMVIKGYDKQQSSLNKIYNLSFKVECILCMGVYLVSQNENILILNKLTGTGSPAVY